MILWEQTHTQTHTNSNKCPCFLQLSVVPEICKCEIDTFADFLNIFESAITVQQNVYIFVILPIALTLTRTLLLILISGEFVPKSEERIRIQKDKSVLVLVEWKTVCSAFLAGGGICTLNPDPNHIFILNWCLFLHLPNYFWALDLSNIEDLKYKHLKFIAPKDNAVLLLSAVELLKFPMSLPKKKNTFVSSRLKLQHFTR